MRNEHKYVFAVILDFNPLCTSASEVSANPSNSQNPARHRCQIQSRHTGLTFCHKYNPTALVWFLYYTQGGTITIRSIQPKAYFYSWQTCALSYYPPQRVPIYLPREFITLFCFCGKSGDELQLLSDLTLRGIMSSMHIFLYVFDLTVPTCLHGWKNTSTRYSKPDIPPTREERQHLPPKLYCEKFGCYLKRRTLISNYYHSRLSGTKIKSHLWVFMGGCVLVPYPVSSRLVSWPTLGSHFKIWTIK